MEVRDGEQSFPVAGAKQRALLALLLVNAKHVVSRERLIDELWGDRPTKTSVQNVHVFVWYLRKLLPPGTLLTRAPGYLLDVEPEELDLCCFERLLADGREALAGGDAERAACEAERKTRRANHSAVTAEPVRGRGTPPLAAIGSRLGVGGTWRCANRVQVAGEPLSIV